MSEQFVNPARDELLAGYFSAQGAIESIASSADALDEVGIKRFQAFCARVAELREQYLNGLPRIPLSRCPFTSEMVRHSFDPFGLDGLWWNYHDPVRPIEDLPATCFALTGSVLLQGEVGRVPFVSRPGAASPYVIPRLLSQPAIRAVISYTLVGEHHGFAISYFADPMPYDTARVNTWGAAYHVFRGRDGKLLRGQTEIDSREADFDLAPWIMAGKLLWIAPGDRTFALQTTLAECPFLSVDRGIGFYEISDGHVFSRSPPAPKQPIIAASTQVETVACPSCGSENRAGKNFCASCGESLKQQAPAPASTAAQTIACPGCGADNQVGKNFCADCGHSLKPQAAQPQAAQPQAAPPQRQNVSRQERAAQATAEVETTRAPPAAGLPDGAPPSLTVRQWVRSLQPRGADDQLVRLEHVQALAAALRRARDEKLIPESKLNEVHRVLQVKGPASSVWTVALRSLRWNQFAAGKWEPAEPPPYAFLDRQMLQSIVALTEQIVAPPAVDREVRPATAPGRTSPVVCPTCGTPQRPNAKFCHVDGTRLAPAPELASSRPPPRGGLAVVLTAAGRRKVQVIKEICTLTGLGLSEVKQLVERAPNVVKERVTPEEANRIKTSLEKLGAKVELQ